MYILDEIIEFWYEKSGQTGRVWITYNKKNQNLMVNGLFNSTWFFNLISWEKKNAQVGLK